MQTTQRKRIDGQARTVRELLFARKYSIDYYQREYKWQTKQVTELVNDLVEVFEEYHKPVHERRAVAGYGHYFLGSVIISDKDGQRFIIDGQQRLTTLTLLLICLRHLLTDTDQKGQLADLILSQQYGARSFNLDVPERTACMEALFNGDELQEVAPSESVLNIRSRYDDLTESLPDSVCGEALPYFADWLIENVHLVEITAYTDEDAYKIFETMNDRGLSLTPKDMLKGYLLANIAGSEERNRASRVWKKQAQELQELGREEDSDAIKAWLRSQHAQTTREHRKDADPGDFDLIGTQFHRWVRDREGSLNLKKSGDYLRFIERDFEFFAAWYGRLRKAAESLEQGLECVLYNAQQSLTLQYPMLLAPLRLEDSEEAILRKLRVVAAYLDILLYRRIWNYRAIDYSTMQSALFRVLKAIRGLELSELVSTLRAELDSDPLTFGTNNFRLHGTNGRQIHRLLARLTDFVATSSGQQSRYLEYSQRGRQGYEIEHIWANHPERHTDEFQNPGDFQEHRNRLGGLLLLPKSFNASYGDMPYEEKLPHYFGQNPLAQSLNAQAYQNNPGFLHFRDESGLPFRPHAEFKKADLDSRQELYRGLAERIWSPERLDREASS